MTAISPVRFFTVVPLHSRYMLLALGVVGLSGVVMVASDPAKGASALGPVALMQMFAASSGFSLPARRGHLDLLFTGGASRLSIALAHLGVSVLPGILVWVIVGIVEMMAGRTTAPQAFASGTVVAFVAISVLAWALTVRAPRLSGAIAWMLGIAVWFVGWSDGRSAVAGARHESADYLTRAVLVTLYPFVLLGTRLSNGSWVQALPVVVLAAALGLSAVIWILRTDVPLEAAQ